MLSFIIPAHNEQLLVGRTLDAVHTTARVLEERYEVIVVDDSSADETASIALEYGARLIQVHHRQIAATRNAGARIANGKFFFFVDADTVVTTRAVQAGLRAMRRGAVGGGCVFRFDGRIPLYARILHPLAIGVARQMKMVGGCCLFCTREAFQATGGFSEEYYAAEEVAFTAALKRQGRFVVPREYVITSGRKVRSMPARQVLALLARIVVLGPSTFRKREGLDIWYGPRLPDSVDVLFAPSEAIHA
jgi:glycosyltransferase involved in cell wall biosynthesis